MEKRMNDDKRFEFGKNWHHYIEKNFSTERVNVSKQHMLSFLQRDNLNDITFLDIGCGSGLHSLAALQSGAKKIYGLDYDINSVKATQFIRNKVGEPSNWSVEQGSVLDEAYMSGLPQFDLVYSWGVLHHTGDVWTAMRIAAQRVKVDGLFYIALYSADVQKTPGPEFWLDIKRKYIASSTIKRRYMELWYVWRFCMNFSITKLPAFIRRARNHKHERGMNIFTDIRDWLGGWPMEFVWDKDAISFCEKMGFKLENIAAGEANTEFLFRRIS